MIAFVVVLGQLSRYQLWCGRDEPPTQTRELRAGPLTAVLEDADLRYVRLGDVEILRRLYVAVRDRNWGTTPARLSNVELDADERSFRLAFDAHNIDEALGIDFSWRGELTGGADGTVTYSLDGVAGRDFAYNRIGFCLLHPADNAGRPYRARTPDGVLEGRLPETIGAQEIRDGLPAPLFPSFEQLEIEVADGLAARFELEGDLFEMEDQRNWTDASFKTYSTPLRLGFPHQAEAGQRIAQRVRISLEGAADRPPAKTDDRVHVTIGRAVGTLPAIGLGMASHGGGLSEREAELLRELRPDHLRTDLDLTADWQAELERAAAAAQQTHARLEVAVFAGETDDGLDELAERLRALDVARILVFRKGEPTTEAATVRRVRAKLDGIAPIGGGTNVLFTDLNRFRPETEPLDAVAYPLNATVHAADDTSVVETAAMHADTVRSAKAFCGEPPICVTPVTFNQRFNPVATGPEPEVPPGELPPQVDPRQLSLLGAGWTLASAKHLAEAGAASVTYFETTGWRGVLETERGSAVPERFPSHPGMVFPLYHVLADLGEWKGGEVLESSSSEPLAVETLAVSAGGALHVLLANLTPTELKVVVDGLAQTATLRRLDETTASVAADDPQAFRTSAEPLASSEIALAPYSVVRVDVA